MWFKMKPQGLDYSESAPDHFLNEIELDASAQRVFDLCFADIDAWAKWFTPDFLSAEWVVPGTPLAAITDRKGNKNNIINNNNNNNSKSNGGDRSIGGSGGSGGSGNSGSRTDTKRPHGSAFFGGVGSERVAVLKDLTVQEKFIAWERPGTDGHINGRFAFTITRANRPLANSVVEDYQLVAMGDNKCRLTWRVHFELRWFMKPAAAKVRKQFGDLFENGIQSLAAYVRENLKQEKEEEEEEDRKVR